MNSTDPVARLAAARLRLLEIWQDPQVRGYARRRAGDRDLADDALQTTYYVMARLKHLAEIENLKAYFYKVLQHEIDRQRKRLLKVQVEDFARVTEDRQPMTGFEDSVCTSVQFWYLHRRLVAERDRALASVPGRSADPDRYRGVIYAAACQILSDGMKGEASEADTNDAFRVSYPAYFAQPGVSANTSDQRFHRARLDVKALLLWAMDGDWPF